MTNKVLQVAEGEEEAGAEGGEEAEAVAEVAGKRVQCQHLLMEEKVRGTNDSGQLHCVTNTPTPELLKTC